MKFLELQEVRILDVLKSSLSGELGVVMSITGDRLDMRGKDGAVVRYKFGKHYLPVPLPEAIRFRKLAREAQKKLETPAEKRKRVRSVTAALKALTKKRRR